MSVWRYSFVTLIGFTIYHRLLFGIETYPSGLAYVESMVPALLALLVTLPIFATIPAKLRYERPATHLLALGAGLALLTLLGANSG